LRIDSVCRWQALKNTKIRDLEWGVGMVETGWLKKAELFETLNDSQCGALLAHATVTSFLEGETIFRQGEEAGLLYILIEGGVNLAVKTDEEIGLMTTRIDKEGAVFGMPSLLEPFRYNVTATCSKASKALVIEADRIRTNIDEDPRIGVEIMKRLATIYFNRLNEMRTGVSHFLKISKLKTSSFA
jgi:CRP/FNR family cyclic AMP-dependent transcriptional regulator